MGNKQEAFVYDRTLRELFQDVPKSLVKLLCNKEAIELLETRFPSVEEKEADLIVKLEDNSILHIEIQTVNDNKMPIRMLQYALLIYKVHQQFPKQIVLYIGEDNITIKNGIIDKNISYNYEVKNLKEIDCSYLLQSDDINDNILSILCNVKDIEKLIGRLNQKLMSLDNKKREDYLRKIFYLLRLRPTLYQELYKIKAKELKMPFTIEKTRDPLYNEGLNIGIEKGIKKGIEKGIEKGIQKGVQKGIIIIAKNMIANGMKLEDIAKITNLTLEQLKKLEKKIDE